MSSESANNNDQPTPADLYRDWTSYDGIQAFLRGRNAVRVMPQELRNAEPLRSTSEAAFPYEPLTAMDPSGELWRGEDLPAGETQPSSFRGGGHGGTLGSPTFKTRVAMLAKAVIDGLSGLSQRPDQQHMLALNLFSIQDLTNRHTIPPVDIPTSLMRRIFWYRHCDNMHVITPFFIGFHQLFEIILAFISRILEKAEPLVANFTSEYTDRQAQYLERKITQIIKAWRVLAELYQTMTTLDRGLYLDYIMRVNTVSGANSPQMISVTKRCYALSDSIPLSDDAIAQLFLEKTQKQGTRSPLQGGYGGKAAPLRNASRTESPHKHASHLVNRLIDLHDAVSRAWTGHLVTAVTVIGITQGTQKTPNTQLGQRVTGMLYDSRLLRILGSCRRHIQGIGCELELAYSMSQYPLAEGGYLSLFDSQPPYFGNHSVGQRSVIYKHIRQQNEPDIDSFYTTHLPRLKSTLLKTLGFDSDGAFRVSIGANVTEFLDRIVTSIRPTNITFDRHEFVAIQRRALYEQCRHKCTLTILDFGTQLTDFSVTVQHLQTSLLILSPVNSITQVAFSASELTAILDTVFRYNPTAHVVLDVAQSICNVDIDYRQVVNNHRRVFIVGSLVKHSRCGEGLGFTVYHVDNQVQPCSGWTSYLGSLATNSAISETTGLLGYDPNSRWEGGTISNIGGAVAATAHLEQMPPVGRQHTYVQGLTKQFLELTGLQPVDALRRQHYRDGSNALTFRVSRPETIIETLNSHNISGVDYKIVEGKNYLRIGFGIDNLNFHVRKLAETLKPLRQYFLE